jgi:hypothetical protein
MKRERISAENYHTHNAHINDLIQRIGVARQQRPERPDDVPGPHDDVVYWGRQRQYVRDALKTMEYWAGAIQYRLEGNLGTEGRDKYLPDGYERVANWRPGIEAAFMDAKKAEDRKARNRFKELRNKCHTFAAPPVHPDRPETGTRLSDISTAEAIETCRAAMGHELSGGRNQSRLSWYLGRAYLSDAQPEKALKHIGLARGVEPKPGDGRVAVDRAIAKLRLDKAPKSEVLRSVKASAENGSVQAELFYEAHRLNAMRSELASLPPDSAYHLGNLAEVFGRIAGYKERCVSREAAKEIVDLYWEVFNGFSESGMQAITETKTFKTHGPLNLFEPAFEVEYDRKVSTTHARDNASVVNLGIGEMADVRAKTPCAKSVEEILQLQFDTAMRPFEAHSE